MIKSQLKLVTISNYHEYIELKGLKTSTRYIQPYFTRSSDAEYRLSTIYKDDTFYGDLTKVVGQKIDTDVSKRLRHKSKDLIKVIMSLMEKKLSMRIVEMDISLAMDSEGDLSVF